MHMKLSLLDWSILIIGTPLQLIESMRYIDIQRPILTAVAMATSAWPSTLFGLAAALAAYAHKPWWLVLATVAVGIFLLQWVVLVALGARSGYIGTYTGPTHDPEEPFDIVVK